MPVPAQPVPAQPTATEPVRTLAAFPSGDLRESAYARLKRRQRLLWALYCALCLTPAFAAWRYVATARGALGPVLYFAGLALVLAGFAYVAGAGTRRRGRLGLHARIRDARVETSAKGGGTAALNTGTASVVSSRGPYGPELWLAAERPPGETEDLPDLPVLPLRMGKWVRCAGDLRMLAQALGESVHDSDRALAERVTGLLPDAPPSPNSEDAARDVRDGNRPRDGRDRLWSAVGALAVVAYGLFVGGMLSTDGYAATPDGAFSEVAVDTGMWMFLIVSGVGVVAFLARPWRPSAATADPVPVEFASDLELPFQAAHAVVNDWRPRYPVRPEQVPPDAVPLSVWPPGPVAPRVRWYQYALPVGLSALLLGGGVVALVMFAGVYRPGWYAWILFILFCLLVPIGAAYGAGSAVQNLRDGRLDAWIHGTLLYLRGRRGVHIADLHHPGTLLVTGSNQTHVSHLKVSVPGRRIDLELPISNEGRRPDRDLQLLAAVLQRSPHELGRAAAVELLRRAPAEELPTVPGLRDEYTAASGRPGAYRPLLRALHGGAYVLAAAVVLLGALTYGTARGVPLFMKGDKDSGVQAHVGTCEESGLVGLHGFGRVWYCEGSVKERDGDWEPQVFRANDFGPQDRGRDVTVATVAGSAFAERPRDPLTLLVFTAGEAAVGWLLLGAFQTWSGRSATRRRSARTED